MSFSKQDQLLQKLQKCVGKLQSRQRPSLPPQREIESIGQVKLMRQKYQKNYINQNIKQPIIETTYKDVTRPKWNAGNQKNNIQAYEPYQNKYKNQGYQRNQIDVNPNYLTQRKDLYNNQQLNKPYSRRDRTQQIKKKYDTNIKIPIPPLTINQSYLQRPNTYTPQTTINSNQRGNRKTLKEYDKQNIQYKLSSNIKKYDNAQPKTYRNYQSSVSKYDTYNYNINNNKNNDKVYNINTNRRNSISICYNNNNSQNLNKSYNTSAFKNRNCEISNRQRQTQNISQFDKQKNNGINFNNNRSHYFKLDRQNDRNRGEDILVDSIIKQRERQRQLERERERGSKQKSRINGIGSISSVSKRVPQTHNIDINVSTTPPIASYSSSILTPTTKQQPIQTQTSVQIPSQPQFQSQYQSKTNVSYQTFQSNQIHRNKQLNLKQILDDVGNANQDTFVKLQKISQLNQRINQRIKNIIDTFQTK